MNWEIAGVIAEVAGVAVVIATLFYVARQLKMSAVQQKLESHRAMAELQISVNRIFYDPKATRSVITAFNDWNSADEDSRMLLSQWLMDTTTLYQTMYQMWIANTVDDDFYKAEENFLVREALASSGGKVWWGRNREIFSTRFVERIESQMIDAPATYFSDNPYAREE